MLGTPSITSITVSPMATTRGEANSERYTPPAMPIGPLMSTVSPLSCSEPTIALSTPGSLSSGLLKKNVGTRYGAAFKMTKRMSAMSGRIAKKAATPTITRIPQLIRCRARSPDVGWVRSFAMEATGVLTLAPQSLRTGAPTRAPQG